MGSGVAGPACVSREHGPFTYGSAQLSLLHPAVWPSVPLLTTRVCLDRTEATPPPEEEEEEMEEMGADDHQGGDDDGDISLEEEELGASEDMMRWAQCRSTWLALRRPAHSAPSSDTHCIHLSQYVHSPLTTARTDVHPSMLHPPNSEEESKETSGNSVDEQEEEQR